jgi:hypothetical protein
MRRANNILPVLFLFIAVSFNLLAESEDFRIIYIIHGDGNYLFHDKEGNALNAAERILEEAKFVAENFSGGEVFIFYQKPAENFLIFFPKDDGEFYYYKNGLMVAEESYSRKNQVNFDAEAVLIKKYFGLPSYKGKNILLYYGHEIPIQNTSGYHSSFQKKEFGIKLFADGVQKLINSISITKEKFDMTILSTCRNGNSETISVLSPFTNYLIASPGDIYLSHLSSKSLIEFNKETNMDTFTIAKGFVQAAYDELCALTTTEISIFIYDIKKISEEFNYDLDSGTTKFYRPSKYGNKNTYPD